MIVDPVVVNPDTVSKNASTKDGILPDIIKGKEPKTDIRIQPIATIATPSLILIKLPGFLNFDIAKPTKHVATILNAKATISLCLYIKETRKGRIMQADSIISRFPSILITIP